MSEINLFVPDSSIDESYSFVNFCRICLQTANKNDYPDVIRPCQCKNFIHKKCLEQQLKIKFQSNCEVCGKIYIFNIYNQIDKSDLEKNINELVSSSYTDRNSLYHRSIALIIVVILTLVGSLCFGYFVYNIFFN